MRPLVSSPRGRGGSRDNNLGRNNLGNNLPIKEKSLILTNIREAKSRYSWTDKSWF